MKWLNFLHFYQPAGSEREKILEALDKSYKNLAATMEKYPQAKFTVNITGCLLARLGDELKEFEFIEKIKKLLAEGRIELVGSAAYHPLLPLIKRREMLAQIKENEAILKKYFGGQLKLRGFFLPEMAYSAEAARVAKKMGYEWLIVDEITAYGKLGAIDPEASYLDLYSGLRLVFRNRKYSQGYVPETLLKLIDSPEIKNQVAVTATDAELYGLRHVDNDGYLDKLLSSDEVSTDTISGYLDSIKDKPVQKIDPLQSSWETTSEEIAENKPFSLWDDDKNPIHVKLWKLAKFSQGLYYKYPQDRNSEWSRWHLVRGLASCTFWWASARDLSHVYGPLAWNPDEVEKGTNEMIKSIRSLEKSTNLKEKLRGESLYFDAKKSIWEKHWHLYDENPENNIVI